MIRHRSTALLLGIRKQVEKARRDRVADVVAAAVAGAAGATAKVSVSRVSRSPIATLMMGLHPLEKPQPI